MGLGKTITCVALIAATLGAAMAFAGTPLSPVLPPPERNGDGAISAASFAGSVWGMPDISDSGSSLAVPKGKAKGAKLQDKLEAEYARACRIKTKSHATLVICPLSTVSNWEDQFREHWGGEVTVVGGSGGCIPAATSSVGNQPSIKSLFETQPSVSSGRRLRVYIYHGNARRPDPAFLADFDVVITTYATLASEFSKQNRSAASAEAEDEEDDLSSDSGGVEHDEWGNPILRIPQRKAVKRKKSSSLAGPEAVSALQSVHWFRVVLDEAQ
jgi:SWI/SNF-related matrix-associated actin-dependent regulator of chromatin subfamily A3